MRNGINLEGTRRAGPWLLLLAVLPWPARAQRILDLPMRAAAGADALATGAIAVFWNPGAIGVPASRGEVLAIDVRGPSSTNLDGIGLAAVARLDDRTALAVGYQRVGIDDIDETSTSPLPDNGVRAIDLAENSFSFAALRSLGNALSVGASVLYTRTSDYIDGDGVVALGTGFRWTPRSSLRPAIAAGLRADEQGTNWFAGASVTRAFRADSIWNATAEYGASGAARYRGITHRAAAIIDWRRQFSASAGVAGEPGAEGHTFKPVVGIGLRLSRYQLNIVREDLPNGIGAVHSFRLGVYF